MRKLLAFAAAVAVLGGVLLVTPQRASAAQYSAWVSLSGPAIAGTGKNCKAPGYNDIQDALNDAAYAYWVDSEAPWVIYVCAGDYIDDRFYVGSPVTLVGAGANRTVINGIDNNDGIFFSNGADLTLKNMSLINGNAFIEPGYGYGNGGAVALYEGGDFACENVVFSNNVAFSNGGAVFARQITTKKCSFRNNASYSSGGALYAYSSYDSDAEDDLGGVVDNASTFSGNTSCHGGAVFTEDGGSFRSSNFSGNSATNSEASEYFWGGCDYYGLIGPSVAPADEYGGGASYEAEPGGGAIYAEQQHGGALTVTASKFQGNRGTFGGAIFATDDYDYYGYDVDAALVNLSKNTFTGNSGCLGGAVFTLGALRDNGSYFLQNAGTTCALIDGGINAISSIWVADDLYLLATKFRGNTSYGMAGPTVYNAYCHETLKSVRWFDTGSPDIDCD